MTKWKYMVESVQITERWGAKRQADEFERFQTRLDVFGSEGWELVAFESVPLTGGFSGNVKGYVYLALFKQPG